MKKIFLVLVMVASFALTSCSTEDAMKSNINIENSIQFATFSTIDTFGEYEAKYKVIVEHGVADITIKHSGYNLYYEIEKDVALNGNTYTFIGRHSDKEYDITIEPNGDYLLIEYDDRSVILEQQ